MTTSKRQKLFSLKDSTMHRFRFLSLLSLLFVLAAQANPPGMHEETWYYHYNDQGQLDVRYTADEQTNYLYNLLGNLIREQELNGSSIDYGYDSIGNRQLRSVDGQDEDYLYDSGSNRLLYTSSDNFNIDDKGNRSSDQNGARTFSYNDDNALIDVHENSQEVAHYTYNAEGQRASKTTSAGTTYFAYTLDGQLSGEYDANGNVIREYLYQNGQPLAQIDDSGANEKIYYLHTDQLGTPRRATDSSGELVWKWSGDAFGASVAVADPNNSGKSATVNLRFPGQYYEQETGLHYNYYRDYDPATGRYIQSDPIGLGGGINTFGYVQQDPLRYIDPFGLLGRSSDWCLQPYNWLTCSEAGGEEAEVAKWAERAAKAAAAAAAAAATTADHIRDRTKDEECPNDGNCDELNDSVQRAKKKVGNLGACLAGMTKEQLTIRYYAWLALATARAKRDEVCWDGGDDGHQQAQAAAWTHVGNCARLLAK